MVLGQFNLSADDAAVLRRGFKGDLKQRITVINLQRLGSVVPFKCPNQQTQPHVDREPTTKDRARQRVFRVMHERSNLRQVDRLVRDMQLFTQLIATNDWSPFKLRIAGRPSASRINSRFRSNGQRTTK